MQPFNRTITALSTPPGKGGVALIRLSGEDAISVAERVFRAASGKPVSQLPARYAAYGDILLDGEPIDDVLLTVFRAPNSYTGEDTVEIASHGGMLITEAILTALYAAGATPASPGEFTRRAYAAGKLSLSEAEAIGELLDAKSMAQVKLFQRDSRARLSGELASLYEGVQALLSSLCARLDYPDEDLGDLSNEEILGAIAATKRKCLSLLSTYKTGKAVAEGVPTVLLGKPNTGKSSLYNLLAGKDAAIVTDLAGTTRDVLETTVPLGRVLLRLSDTAGVRESDDPVEKIGVTRAKEAAKNASLLLILFDASAPADGEDEALLSFLDTLEGEKIALLNKSDLSPMQFDTSLLEGHVARVLPFSAKDGDLETLTGLVDRIFTDGELKLGEDAVLFSARSHAALKLGCDRLSAAEEALRTGFALDAALTELEGALSAFAETDGRSVGEDVVAGIFSKFCVGK